VRTVILALAILALAGPLQAQYGQKGGRGKMQEGPRGEKGDVVRPSGLQPAYPAQARCPEIASPFGSQTRYDGSSRPQWEFGGYHGGIDISLAEGTPLLALAAGTVAAKGEGGMMEGNYLWLRHSPEDTGLDYWLYSKYQHLASLPELEVGAKVTTGQIVARSGRTGTVGGHYGGTGYPHLHLGTARGRSGDEPVGGRGETRGVRLFDPLAIYYEAGGKQAQAVSIPYASTDGKVSPSDTRVVWPVACPPR